MFDINIQEFLQTLSIWAIPVLLAITLHEAAHGYVARLCGDNTAYMLGRVTLNPVKHIDPFGTLLVPLVLMLVSPFIIGWARPVPVNFNNLKDERWGTVAVALAGPGANLLLAILSVLALHFTMGLSNYWAEPLSLMLVASIKINVLLMVFNLLPLLPLDGGRVLAALLPPKISYEFSKTERWGMMIIILLAVTGVLFQIIVPLMNGVLSLLMPFLP